MTNKSRGVLYVGVTNALHVRVDQHRRGVGSEFCRQYNLHRLVLAERHEDIREAIAREIGIEGVEARMEDQVDRGGEPGMARSVRPSRLAA